MHAAIKIILSKAKLILLYVVVFSLQQRLRVHATTALAGAPQNMTLLFIFILLLPLEVNTTFHFCSCVVSFYFRVQLVLAPLTARHT